jgi:predicted nicotinamide N-methyase
VTQTAVEIIETTVGLPGRGLTILRPRDSEALLDEEAFERNEFLPYWAELWPSGLALARVVAARDLRNRRVIELGCGLALPSIVAALGGAHVLATDWSADALVLAATNAHRNGAELEVAVCSWAAPDPIVDLGPWDLVLASDVLYERQNVELLLGLLPRLAGEVLLADPGRPAAKPFLEQAARDGWQVSVERDDLLARVTLYRLTRARQ